MGALYRNLCQAAARPDGMKGTVGIIGPRRMDYERVIDVLRHMMEQLDDLYK